MEKCYEVRYVRGLFFYYFITVKEFKLKIINVQTWGVKDKNKFLNVTF